MDKYKLESRTKKFSLDLINFISKLGKSKISDVMGYQLLKSGTSIGANYREANRAESKKDFIHKIGIVDHNVAKVGELQSRGAVVEAVLVLLRFLGNKGSGALRLSFLPGRSS